MLVLVWDQDDGCAYLPLSPTAARKRRSSEGRLSDAGRRICGAASQAAGIRNPEYTRDNSRCRPPHYVTLAVQLMFRNEWELHVTLYEKRDLGRSPQLETNK
jgi:hypothetical protein